MIADSIAQVASGFATAIAADGSATLSMPDPPSVLRQDNEKTTGGGAPDAISEKTPDFIAEKRVPTDRETILRKDPSFQKTKIPRVKGATVYKKDKFFYHRDTLHKADRAHLEVYDAQGKHLGEADVFTGKLISDTADKTKILRK